MNIVTEFARGIVVALAAELRGVYRRAMRGKVSHAEPAQPLSHAEVEHQQSQIRSATTGRAILPRTPPERPVNEHGENLHKDSDGSSFPNIHENEH